MRLTLRKRIVVAVAAIAVIHAGFYYVPKYLDERPRFYPQAHAEAVEILKEEVGGQAVEKGVLSIAREVSVPSKAVALIARNRRRPWERWSNMREEVIVAVDGDRAFLSESIPTLTPWSYVERRLFGLSADDGRRAVAVLTYLDSVRGEGILAGSEQCDPDVLLFTAAGSPERWYSPGWGDPLERPVRDELVGRCAQRYVARFLSKGDFKELATEDEVVPLAIEVLGSNVPPRDDFALARAETAAGWLEDFPDARALPVLRRVKNIAEARERMEGLQNWPAVGWFVKALRPERPLPLNANWRLKFVEKLAGGPPGHRLEAALAKARKEGENVGLPPHWGSANLLARWRPEEYAEVVASHLAGHSFDAKVEAILDAYPGGLREVGEAAVKDGEPLIRAYGYYLLYLATGDPSFITKCLEERPIRDGQGFVNGKLYPLDCSFEVVQLLYMLADTYLSDKSLDEIPAFFARELPGLLPHVEHYSGTFSSQPAGTVRDCAKMMFSVIAVGAGREDMERTFNDVESEAKLPEDNYAPYFLGPWATAAMIDSRNPAFADAMIEYLNRHAPRLDDAVCVVFTKAISASGDRRALPLLKEAIEGDKKSPGKSKYHITITSADWWAPRENLAYFIRRTIEAIRIRENPAVISFQGSEVFHSGSWPWQCGRRILAETLSAKELEAVLADENCKVPKSLVYLALVRRREMDERSAEPDKGVAP